jgi:hypothetical protein
MDIARVFAEKDRLQGTQDGRKTGSEKALTEALNYFIGFDANEGPIEIALDDSGFEANDFQKSRVLSQWTAG